ncbi:MAG: PIN domain-containing protein [Candidatus Symbiodolus clandestinus]
MSTASVYGQLRASCTLAGVTLGALDMLIAAHAVATHSTLVTRDKAFLLIPNQPLSIEDWTTSANL